MVGRTRYSLPLNGSLARKFDALRERVDLRVLATAPRGAAGGDATVSLQRGTGLGALDGPRFYGSLPVRIARERPAQHTLFLLAMEKLPRLGRERFLVQVKLCDHRFRPQDVRIDLTGPFRRLSQLSPAFADGPPPLELILLALA